MRSILVINQCKTSKMSCLLGRCIFLYISEFNSERSTRRAAHYFAAGPGRKYYIYNKIEKKTRFQCILQQHNNMIIIYNGLHLLISKHSPDPNMEYSEDQITLQCALADSKRETRCVVWYTERGQLNMVFVTCLQLFHEPKWQIYLILCSS